VTLEVVPLTVAGRMHYLVLFDEREEKRGDARKLAGKPSETAKRASSVRERTTRLELLQRELAASREYLQSIIQELEAANEELQSANEEILSSNEELQSTNEELDTAKEELQSTNEELNTVNEELHGRNDELTRVNSDLVNLVGSVQIAIVIVSSDLRIRRFTPMAEKILNLIPADLERSIGHINPNIDCPNLEQLIVECIDSVSTIERDVRDRQGRWYSLRIRPYKSVDNKIDGAVLALFDVDILKRSEQRVQMASQYAEAILETTAQAFVVLEADLRVKSVNNAFCKLFGVTRSEVEGRTLEDLGGGQLDLEPLRAALSGSSVDAVSFDDLRLELSAPGGAPRSIAFTGRSLRWHESPDARLLLLAVSDQTAFETA
jgi:two-component system, chemotaxis family, CheB/CheR fusion protein